MAQNLQMCEISEELKGTLKKFRLRKEKTIAAIILKINKDSMKVEIEETLEDIDIDEIKENLPERNPRFVILSYVRKHSDGRVSYPLIFIHLCPYGCKTELNMIYAGTRNALTDTVKLNKFVELRDLDEFDQEWLEEKLKIYT